MLKIGEFSKLAHTTIKTLRYYEKEELLIPVSIDENNGYRYYETSQLEILSLIKSYRQLGFSIEEIKKIFNGFNKNEMLRAKAYEFEKEKINIDIRLSIIRNLLEGKSMNYQVVEKVIPECIVYYAETILKKYSDAMTWIPSIGEECKKLNPNIKCIEPCYNFCEYLDGEYKEENIRVRYSEEIGEFGKENIIIKFKSIPSTKVLSILHKGQYDKIGDAYVFIMKYVNENGYKVSGLPRECYIDGIWNKETVDEWLTEIQVPIE